MVLGQNYYGEIISARQDRPYGVSVLNIQLAQDANGDYTSEVTGLTFNNELYSVE